MTATLPKPNIPLLRAVLAQIDAHPERWVQADWATKTDCGTAFCVAGWAAHITHPDAQPVFDGCQCWACGGGITTNYLTLTDGRRVSIRDTAEDALGLTFEEADMLFASGNSRADVQRYAELIAARAGESL